MSSNDQKGPPSLPNQGPVPPNNQYRQGSPSLPGQASGNNQPIQVPPPQQGPIQMPPSQNGSVQIPGSNPPVQGPPSWQGQGSVPPHNPPVQGPPSLHGQGPMPANNPPVQGPPPWQGQGPVPPHNPPVQGPPSWQGQRPVPTGNQHVQNTPAIPEQTQPEKTGVSRRKLIIGGALVGGSLAAVGGIALATQSSSISSATTAQQQTTGTIREYWVQANAFMHNLVPTGYDGMMGMRFEAHQSSYWAVGYVAYTPNWGKPLAGNDDIGPNTGIPGPVFRGSVGDTIRVHFRNNDTHYRYPHSMHPHGVLYTPANDGAWIASDQQPGASVAFGQSYTYEWHVRPNSVGTWVYHDHSPSVTVGSSMLMEYGAELGLFGFLVMTDASTKPATKEFFTFFARSLSERCCCSIARF